jgi:hypothetical protein
MTEVKKEKREIVLKAKTQILEAIRLKMDTGIYEDIIIEAIEKSNTLTNKHNGNRTNKHRCI